MDSKKYDTEEISRILNLSYCQLEYWVLVGLVKPTFEAHGTKWHQKFSSEDLRFLKEVKALTDQGYLVSRAAEKVRGSRLPEVSWRTPVEGKIA